MVHPGWADQQAVLGAGVAAAAGWEEQRHLLSAGQGSAAASPPGTQRRSRLWLTGARVRAPSRTKLCTSARAEPNLSLAVGCCACRWLVVRGRRIAPSSGRRDARVVAVLHLSSTAGDGRRPARGRAGGTSLAGRPVLVPGPRLRAGVLAPAPVPARSLRRNDVPRVRLRVGQYSRPGSPRRPSGNTSDPRGRARRRSFRPLRRPSELGCFGRSRCWLRSLRPASSGSASRKDGTTSSASFGPSRSARRSRSTATTSPSTCSSSRSWSGSRTRSRSWPSWPRCRSSSSTPGPGSWPTVRISGSSPRDRCSTIFSPTPRCSCLAWATGYVLDRYELLTEATGAVFGAGYTAVHVTSWALLGRRPAHRRLRRPRLCRGRRRPGAAPGRAGRWLRGRHGLDPGRAADIGAALRRAAERAGARDALPAARHRVHAAGVRPGGYRDAHLRSRRRARHGGDRGEPGHHRQHPALGLAAAPQTFRQLQQIRSYYTFQTSTSTATGWPTA